MVCSSGSSSNGKEKDQYTSRQPHVWKEGWVEEDLWTKTLVPGGERGVVVKSKSQLMAMWAERLGFLREYQSR